MPREEKYIKQTHLYFSSAWKAYGCLETIKDDVTMATKKLLKNAADEADTFIAQAQENLKEAKAYYRKATDSETMYRQKIDEQKALFRKREKEVWTAEEKYNTSCQLGHCKKSKYMGYPSIHPSFHPSIHPSFHQFLLPATRSERLWLQLFFFCLFLFFWCILIG